MYVRMHVHTEGRLRGFSLTHTLNGPSQNTRKITDTDNDMTTDVCNDGEQSPLHGPDMHSCRREGWKLWEVKLYCT
jgi:hypothetical protein